MLRLHPCKSSHGFTLVELAIGMAIIGLLLAGILKGQELVRNSNFKKTIALIDSFDAAGALFRDKYDYLPGDMLRANLKIPGCAIGCLGGNGDGIIGRRNLDAATYQTSTSLPDYETSLFWIHLSRADLLVIEQAVPDLPNPKSPVGGMFSIYHRSRIHGYSIKTPTAAGGMNILSPGEAMDFDQYVDGTPNPSAGRVLAHGSSGCDVNSPTYNRNATGFCRMLFAAKF